jgi:small subunit ribosomal protein S15
MNASKQQNKKSAEDIRLHKKDTGSSAVQIVRLTERIRNLTHHFKEHKKDHHSRYGLIKMVSQRKKLLRYLKDNELEKYNEIISKLNIRN